MQAALSHVMPYLQLALLLITTTTLGAFLCGPGLIHLMVLAARPKPGQLWAPGLLLFLIYYGGTLFGGISGFLQGRRSFGRQGITPWGSIAWCGAVLGLGIGILLYYHDSFGRLWFGSVMVKRLYDLGFIALHATFGGVAGSVFEAWREKQRKLAAPARRGNKKKRKRPPVPSGTP
jgi:hypothetical protein